MTKDEALRLALEALEYTGLKWPQVEEAITAIKAALEAKDEPVAWMYEVNHAHTCLDLFEPPDDAYDEGTLYPLYTTPPQRTWVGLTDEEIQKCLQGLPTQTIDVYARRIEAKLRSKNNG